MSMLERKLRRDLWRLRGQVATIALVLACGVMAMVMLRSTYTSLLAARDAYYARFGLGDVFAHLERAPDAFARRIATLPGVASVYPRIARPVMVPIADEADPVAGTAISLPDVGEAPLGQLYLRSGRMPQPGSDEAVVLEQFAVAHALQPGATLPVVLDGRLRAIRIVGIALSPEYVLASSRGGFVDPRRFVVLWMSKKTLAPAFQMDGAFDDLVLRLERGADPAAVIDLLDRELVRYGGTHAIPREKQASNYMLSSELGVLRTLALAIPAIFLAVAAFLVNVVISRLVFLERTQIAILKALGFTNRRIALHYLGLVALIVAIAGVLGTVAGMWTGRWMTALYASIFRFPMFEHRVTASLVAGTIAIGLGSAVVGALGAVRRVVRLPPAQAMRPPAPAQYRRSRAAAAIGRTLGMSVNMIVREIQARPVRFFMSTLGIAMGIAIFVMGRFGNDSFDVMMHDTYLREHHEDLIVQLERAMPARAVDELAHVPGVDYAEGQRFVPVRLRAGARWRDAMLVGLPDPPVLRRLLDHGTRPMELPREGVVMTDKLAEILHVRVGDEVDAELLEYDWKTHHVLVAGLIDESFGLQAYARAGYVSRVIGEEPRVSTILLGVDPAHAEGVRARLKELPAVIGVTSTQQLIATYDEQTGRSVIVMTLILTLSASAIAIGVVYNNARIALSLRSRDLATLRVLGFTRREISSVLLGELALQVLLGIPLGLWLGTQWAKLLARGFDQEAIRFPLHVSMHTYVLGAVIALVSGAVSALLVRRKLDTLDLVAVLKSSWE